MSRRLANPSQNLTRRKTHHSFGIDDLLDSVSAGLGTRPAEETAGPGSPLYSTDPRWY